MTGGERSWVGSIPPHFLFYLDLISYLSIYLLYLLLHLSVHNHFLTYFGISTKNDMLAKVRYFCMHSYLG